MRRFLRDPVVLDRAAALATTVALQMEVWLGHGSNGHRLPYSLLGLLITLPVAFRRARPLEVALFVNAVVLVEDAVWGPQNVISLSIAWICVMYGLAVWTGPRAFAGGMIFFAAGTYAATLGPSAIHDPLAFAVIALIVIVLVRWGVRGRDERLRLAVREQDLRARAAVVDERARIARELHDVVAHSVSVMVVQAGAERRVLDDEQTSTRETLTSIEQTGRQALAETRRLLGMLRRTDDEPALAPQPSLDRLDLLVEQMREAGLPVELSVEGTRRALAPGIELSAYRIVQEALTNTLKHAGPATARVAVRYGERELEIEVDDDGGGGTNGDGGGHGLVGMRERVSLYGGHLDAGRAERGYTVRAVLPLS